MRCINCSKQLSSNDTIQSDSNYDSDSLQERLRWDGRIFTEVLDQFKMRLYSWCICIWVFSLWWWYLCKWATFLRWCNFYQGYDVDYKASCNFYPCSYSRTASDMHLKPGIQKSWFTCVRNRLSKESVPRPHGGGYGRHLVWNFCTSHSTVK